MFAQFADGAGTMRGNVEMGTGAFSGQSYANLIPTRSAGIGFFAALHLGTQFDVIAANHVYVNGADAVGQEHVFSTLQGSAVKETLQVAETGQEGSGITAARGAHAGWGGMV
jgi:hypothetical protein